MSDATSVTAVGIDRPPLTGDESIDAALTTVHDADALGPSDRLDAGRHALAVLQQRLDHLDRT